jgi:hypothetical protein
MLNSITVNLPVNDWVWLCEFLSTVIKEGKLDPYSKADTQRLLDLLQEVTH